MRALTFLTAALLLASCASPSGLGRAEPIAAGSTTALGGLELQSGFSKRGRQVPTPWLSPYVGVRHGVHDDVELGARGWAFGAPNLYTVGAAGYAKWRVSKPAGEVGWHISLVPELGWHMVSFTHDPTYAAWIAPNILFGYSTAEGHQVVLGLKPRGELWYDRDQTPIGLGYLGGSFAYSIQANADWRVTPEVNLAWTPLSWNGLVEDKSRRGFSQLHLGLTFERAF
jgi:hypothetical protein